MSGLVSRPSSPAARLGDRLFSVFGIRLVVWLLAAQAFLPGVLLDPPNRIGGYHDEHAEIYAEESARRSFVEHHQLPQWDPYWCGGVVALSNAGSLVVAPDFLLRIIYGTLAGKRLALLLFVILGMEGTFRYARANRASGIASAVAAVAFSSSGSFPPMLALGWGFLFHFNLIPWALLGFELGLKQKWWIPVGGAAMAWILLGAGTYALPYTILVLVLLTLFETLRAVFARGPASTIPWWRPAATFVGIGVVGAALSAIRLVPLLNLLASHTRLVMQKDQTGPLSVVAMLALPREHANWGGGAGEYYIGSAIFVFSLVALLFADRRAAKFWAIAFFLAVLACGEFIEDSPYSYMRKLPIYGQLRFPTRMLTVAGFFIALAASRGLTRLEDLVPRAFDGAWARIRRWRESLPERVPLGGRVALAVFAAFLAVRVGLFAAQDVLDHTMVAPGTIYTLDGPQVVDQPFRQARGNRWDGHVWPFARRGSLHCFDENQLFESPYLRADLPAEEYPAPDSPDLTVERVSWSPHRIVLRVHVSTPGRILVNQNHAPSWHTDVGTIGSDGGLISIRVPAGDHVVNVTYDDWRVWVGGAISLATVLALGAFGFVTLRRRMPAFRRWFRLWQRRPSSVPSVADVAHFVAGERSPPLTRSTLALVLALALFSVGYATLKLRDMTANLRHSPPLATLPPSGDAKFGLPLELRRRIFEELAAAEPQSRIDARARFAGPELMWSADDDRGATERKVIASAMARHHITMTQAYMVLDEGIHERWLGPDGKPLEATTTPLHPRRNYGW